MSDDGRPDWDQNAADAMIGAVVLIGITHVQPDGYTQEQMFGVITSADPGGFEVVLSGSRTGESYWLPPDPSCFEVARPGEYRLRSTGETVVDPDFLSQWTIEPPQN